MHYQVSCISINNILRKTNYSPEILGSPNFGAISPLALVSWIAFLLFQFEITVGCTSGVHLSFFTRDCTNSGCKLGIGDARCTGLGQHSTVFRCMLTSRFNMHQSLALVPILHFNPQNVGTTPSQYRLGVSVCMHFLVNYPHRYI